VADDRVIVERDAGGKMERREWNRQWLRVEMTEGGFGRPGRLTLCCGRDRWEFGNALPAQERAAVARDLKRLTGARQTRRP
jgi:uncharacterized membrane protein